MYLEMNQMRINYTLRGSGEYVFMLHGWGSSLAPYENLANIIAKKYTVVSFDFPGFGGSDEPPEAWDVGQFADLTIDFIRHFQCNRVILLGHSFGGRVIIKMSARDSLPFHIQKIILIDSAGIKPPPSPNQSTRSKVFQFGKKVVDSPFVKSIAPDAGEALRRHFGSADYAAASPIMRGCLVKTVNEDLTSLLPQVTASTLLIWGADDDATPLADGQLMEQMMPDAGLVTLQNAGHYSFLDQAYTTHRVVQSFLSIGD